MPTIGLILEGEYDQAVIPVLLKRCRDGVRVATRLCKGSVAGKSPGFVTELRRTYRPEKVLVVSDADGHEPSKVISRIESRLAKNHRATTTILVIVEMLEAWLIADPKALENVLRVKKSFASPERIRQPKEELEKLCAGRTVYTPELAGRNRDGLRALAFPSATV
jgi:hypothetical protein